MKLNKLFAGLTIIVPIVGTISLTSCNNPEYITPKINCNKEQVGVSCSNIELNKDFTITTKTVDGYTVSSISVVIGTETVSTTKETSSRWRVSGTDVNSKTIEITVVTTAITEQATDYIYDRSFSIYGTASGGSACFGTGWILSDATPSNTTDYQYYIATNWHVKVGMDTLSSIKFYYGDATPESKSVTNFKQFSSFAWETNQNNFCYTAGSTLTAIDMYVAKVTFGSDMPSQIKTKLTKLNNLQASKGYITKFGKTVSSSDNYSSSTIHIAGYPYKTSRPEWRYETISPNGSSFYSKNSSHNHYFDGTSKLDISPQYGYIDQDFEAYLDSSTGQWVPYDDQWGLSGGSSGSMAVVYDSTEWVVVGIYWGGSISGDYIHKIDPVYFHPHLSIFKSTDKDFTTPYLPK